MQKSTTCYLVKAESGQMRLIIALCNAKMRLIIALCNEMEELTRCYDVLPVLLRSSGESRLRYLHLRLDGYALKRTAKFNPSQVSTRDEILQCQGQCLQDLCLSLRLACASLPDPDPDAATQAPCEF